MKTLKFLKINFMLVVALLTAGITMSFKTADQREATTVHYYISTDMSPGAFRNVANWSTTNNSIGCVTEEEELPCKITVPDGSTLSSVLASKSNPQVLVISEGYKPAF